MPARRLSSTVIAGTGTPAKLAGGSTSRERIWLPPLSVRKPHDPRVSYSRNPSQSRHAVSAPETEHFTHGRQLS
jgi:hypothetical protein